MSKPEMEQESTPRKKRTGFALMAPEDRDFKCHRWTKETAALAGKKGGCHDSERMRALGRAGGKTRGEQMKQKAKKKVKPPKRLCTVPAIKASVPPAPVSVDEARAARLHLLRQRAAARQAEATS